MGPALRNFAKLLGLKDEHAEDALHSERVAIHVSRRGFIGAAGALAGGIVYSFGSGEVEAAEPVIAGPVGTTEAWTNWREHGVTGCVFIPNYAVGATGYIYSVPFGAHGMSGALRGW